LRPKRSAALFTKAGVYPNQYQYNQDLASCQEDPKASLVNKPLNVASLLAKPVNDQLVNCIQSKGYSVRRNDR
jgi:hypothetical protein